MDSEAHPNWPVYANILEHHPLWSDMTMYGGESTGLCVQLHLCHATGTEAFNKRPVFYLLQYYVVSRGQTNDHALQYYIDGVLPKVNLSALTTCSEHSTVSWLETTETKTLVILSTFLS